MKCDINIGWNFFLSKYFEYKNGFVCMSTKLHMHINIVYAAILIYHNFHPRALLCVYSKYIKCVTLIIFLKHFLYITKENTFKIYNENMFRNIMNIRIQRLFNTKAFITRYLELTYEIFVLLSSVLSSYLKILSENCH